MENLMSFSDLSLSLGARLFSPTKLAPGGGGQSSEFHSSGFSSVSVDSRNVKSGGLFVALRGSVLDGHKFVDAAFKAGAAGAIVALSAMEDRALNLPDLGQRWNRVLVGVEDTLKALQDAAAAYLKRFSRLVKVGITGSSGKTTTKEIAAAIISREKSVVMNKGNMNSETGLPLSVFDVRSHHETGIFEAGVNRKGEMAALAKILNPDLALITNIGSAHIGILGSRKAIAEEKKEFFSFFTGNNTAMIPENDDFRDFLAEGVRGRIVFYGPSSLKALGGTKELGLNGSEITWDGETVRFGIPGKVNLINALAAVALSGELAVSSTSIREGLASVKPIFGRGEILHGRTTVIRDCYNSNPESVMEALDFCDSLQSGRKVYVMGSMLELGDICVESHIALGKRLAECRADMVFLLGEEIAVTADVLEKASPGKVNYFHTCDKNELSQALDNFIKKGDLVLLKGSRLCELETLTEMLLGDENVS